MEKKGYTFYENLYLDLLNKLKNAKTEEEKKNIRLALVKLREDGLSIKNEKVDTGSLSTEEYYEYRNNKNYSKFAGNNAVGMHDVTTNSVEPQAEINRVKKAKKRRITKKVITGVVIAGLAIGLASCAKSCSKKKSNTTGTTITSSLDQTSGSSINTTGTTTNGTTRNTTEFNDKDAIASMSDEMGGYDINDPNYAEYYGDGVYADDDYVYGLYHDDVEYGDDHFGETVYVPTFPTLPSSTTVTEGTTTTPTTTTTTTETTTTTTTGDPVPTTTAPETQNTEPADDRNMRDVVVDEYDNVQPSYVEEDVNETYETYVNTEGTTETTTTTTSTYSYDGMEVEDDENETYETYMTFETKAANQAKGSAKTLRYRK